MADSVQKVSEKQQEMLIMLFQNNLTLLQGLHSSSEKVKEIWNIAKIFLKPEPNLLPKNG